MGRILSSFSNENKKMVWNHQRRFISASLQNVYMVIDLICLFGLNIAVWDLSGSFMGFHRDFAAWWHVIWHVRFLSQVFSEESMNDMTSCLHFVCLLSFWIIEMSYLDTNCKRTVFFSVSGCYQGGLMARNHTSYVSSLTLALRRMCESGCYQTARVCWDHKSWGTVWVMLGVNPSPVMEMSTWPPWGLTGRVAHDPRGQLVERWEGAFFCGSRSWECKCCEKHPWNVTTLLLLLEKFADFFWNSM